MIQNLDRFLWAFKDHDRISCELGQFRLRFVQITNLLIDLTLYLIISLLHSNFLETAALLPSNLFRVVVEDIKLVHEIFSLKFDL